MTPEQKHLVRSTFALVAPISQQAGALFYSRLFELDPGLRPMFKGDFHEQVRKLMDMLRVAVASLDRLEGIVPAVRRLGERHVSYGVQPLHYATVGEALLWTLEKGLGPAFTAEAREAWMAVFMLLAGVMQDANSSPDDSIALDVAA